MAFIKIHDDRSDCDEYIVNTNNVCCVKYYVKTSGLKDSKTNSSITYWLEIYFTNDNQLNFNFKDSETWNHYIQKFKDLIREEKGEEQDEGLQQNCK